MNTAKLKVLALNDEDVDGVSFSINEDKSNYEKLEWNFSIMRITADQKPNYHKFDTGYKYQIVLYKKDRAEVFEAIIGDLQHYVTRLVNMEQEGIVIRKCEKSMDIMNKIFHGQYEEALEMGLVESGETPEAL
jgi:hypothetical protein